MAEQKIKVLFCDLGGVVLTNGWDHNSRKLAAETFGFDFAEMNSRHQMVFGDYEIGKLTLEEYLHYAVFYKPRSFSQKAFIQFMYAQSKKLPEMFDYVCDLRKRYNLKIVIVSNEGRELTVERFRKFHLNDFADFFLVSCFTGLRKPDRQVYRLALDVVQVPPDQIIYLDDRDLFTEIANEMGINAIHHIDLDTTRKAIQQIMERTR